MKIEKSEYINNPLNQLNLFGYEYYFDLFDELYQKNKLPHSILLSGNKGLGKATFAYHFINYLLSQDEKNKYDNEKISIDQNNISYKLAVNETHPNLFILVSPSKTNILHSDIKITTFFTQN